MDAAIDVRQTANALVEVGSLEQDKGTVSLLLSSRDRQPLDHADSLQCLPRSNGCQEGVPLSGAPSTLDRSRAFSIGMPPRPIPGLPWIQSIM